MKIIVKKEEFEKKMNLMSGVIQNTSPLASLRGIVIVATNSDITLLCSNGNLSIKEKIFPSNKIKIIEAGKILVPGNLFKNIIKKINSEITVFSNEKTVFIQTPNSKMQIQLLNISEYPKISFEKSENYFNISVKTFHKIVKDVFFASAENDKRIILNGINFKAKNKILKISATDSFRISQQTIGIDSNIEFDITVLNKNIKNILSLEIEGNLKINIDDYKIMIQHQNTNISSKLISDLYPDVSKLIPKKFNSFLKINSKKLLKLIDQTIVVSEETNKIIKLTINEKEMILESKKTEIGESKIFFQDFEYKGKEMKIILNAKFLMDAIYRFDEDILIGFNEPLEPFIIKSEKEENKLIHLILPNRNLY